ncbi:hypothetical protein [Streptococcus equi]|uniref:hypothetical protein n=1 Tax=Streptococcus equi TaxID=1336 RepID=UPI001E4D079B|nr:hypothetical protein [Streptococcus equi]
MGLTGTYYITLENTGTYDDLADLLNHQLVITYQDKTTGPLYVLAMNSLSSDDQALDAEYSLGLIKSALKSVLESEHVDLKPLRAYQSLVNYQQQRQLLISP